MNPNLVAKATTTIAAPKAAVWHALLAPEALKLYMFGADVRSDWREGSEIVWQGEFKGKKFRDKGVVIRNEPERTLEYTHFSPMSGLPERPENYHTVTVDLTADGDKTKVSLSQDNNRSDQARRESEKNWGLMLEGLKQYLETPPFGE